ncbi:MAG TPA: DUF3072 domain-containing protein [Vicinamibacterales bacterium]|nr:DUF3072 domain-containing protein [Vicinamibacterales bacterium]
MKNQTDDSTIKHPDEWKTGDDPATPSQRSYLETLAAQAGEPADAADDELTKADASKRIDELREKAGLDRAGR